MDMQSKFVDQPKILKENVEYFVHEPGARDTVSSEGAPEYIYAIEEAAELIQSITKLARRAGSEADLADEMAHVYITIANLRQMYDISLTMIQNAIDEKMFDYGLKTSTEVPKPKQQVEKHKLNVIELTYDRDKGATYIPGTEMQRVMHTLMDECSANAKCVAVSHSEVNWQPAGTSYSFLIHIFDDIPEDSYQSIMRLSRELRDRWSWRMHLMKGETDAEE